MSLECCRPDTETDMQEANAVLDLKCPDVLPRTVSIESTQGLGTHKLTRGLSLQGVMLELPSNNAA